MSFELTTKLVIMLNTIHILLAMMKIASDAIQGEKVEIKNYLHRTGSGIILGILCCAIAPFLTWIYIVGFLCYLGVVLYFVW
jgi:hypothetical protein